MVEGKHPRPAKSLILVRGAPGSGKSTYAKTLGIKDHFEADMWFDLNGGWQPDKIKEAHEWCQNQAEEAMKAGRPVVVANTFIRLWEMQHYIDLAEKYGYQVEEIIANGGFDNVHGVPKDKVDLMRSNLERR